jgi:hypothetical protein
MKNWKDVKGSCLAEFKELYRQLPGGTGIDHEKLQLG